MRLNEIRDNKGSTHGRKILGRGIGSGLGKTSGKGHKGQKARGSGKVRLGFEGGQNPIYRRMPKRGFNNPFTKNYFIINIGCLSKFIEIGKIKPDVIINYNVLEKSGILKGCYDGVKILGKGQLDYTIKCEVNSVSSSALEKIKFKGGNVELLEKKIFVNPKNIKK